MSTHQQAIDRQIVADALLKCGPWNCRHDDDALIEHARAQARAIEQEAAALGDPVLSLQRAERRARLHCIEPPSGYGTAGSLGRLSCPRWWRRQLRRLTARRREQRQRLLGRVSKRTGIYVSNEGLARRREQNTRNAMLLDAMVATNQGGQEYTLAELAELGLANPNNRRAELMLRIADTEAEAQRLGHVGMFYTITCPSRFHAVHAKTSRINAKYEGADPREAQAYLQSLWSRARAALARRELGIYGIRVVEPHHDGTPHWHLLLWMRPEQQAAITDLLRQYAIAEDRGEIAGRETVRFKPVMIDPAKGSAAGYVAKYIAKNINGQQFGEVDHYGQPLESSAPRIEAWAATWGVRQFQFVGLPSVTVWRETRRITDAQLAAMDAWEEATRPEPEAAAIMAELRTACNAGQWDQFLRLMGGPMTPRSDQPVRPWRLIQQDARAADCDRRGRYGEPVIGTLGLIVTSAVGEAEYLTRFYRWDVAPKGAASEFDFERLSAAKSPWSPVNNCTPPADRPPLSRWEIRVTQSLQTMSPPVYPSQLAKIRQEIASDAERYQIESAKRRADKQAQRERVRLIREAEEAVIDWFIAGDISQQQAIEALSA